MEMKMNFNSEGGVYLCIKNHQLNMLSSNIYRVKWELMWQVERATQNLRK